MVGLILNILKARNYFLLVCSRIEDHVMLCGGKVWDTGEGVNTADCWDYWPCSNRWMPSQVPPMSQARTGAGAVLTRFPGYPGPSFWVLGGSDDEGTPRSSTEILDLETNTWRAGDIPTELFEISEKLNYRFFSILLLGGPSLVTVLTKSLPHSI